MLSYVIPALIFAVVLFALLRRKSVYSSFIDGVNAGLRTALHIFPAIAAIMTASYMLRASGAIDMLTRLISPVTTAVGMPPEAVPLALIRPVSGSGSLGMLTDMLAAYGADSKIGKVASVITGSTETTFYVICVYFANTRVKNTARLIMCAVIGDLAGILSGTVIVNLMG